MFGTTYKKILGKHPNDPVVTEIVSINEDPVVDELIDLDNDSTPEEFSKMCRTYLKERPKGTGYRNKEFLNNPETGRLDDHDIKYLSKVLHITGAFLGVNNNAHRNLILSVDKNKIRTYDPMTTRTRDTIREFDTSDIDCMMISLSEDLQNEYERQSDGMPKHIEQLPDGYTLECPEVTLKDFLIKMNGGKGYKVSESFIDWLGAPQNNSYDCGPLSLYAAKMSNKEQKVLDRY